MGVKSRAGDVVLRVDWLILADAKCRAEKLIQVNLFAIELSPARPFTPIGYRP